jgi:hypothetical protein
MRGSITDANASVPGIVFFHAQGGPRARLSMRSGDMGSLIGQQARRLA